MYTHVFFVATALELRVASRAPNEESSTHHIVDKPELGQKPTPLQLS